MTDTISSKCSLALQLPTSSSILWMMTTVTIEDIRIVTIAIVITIGATTIVIMIVSTRGGIMPNTNGIIVNIASISVTTTATVHIADITGSHTGGFDVGYSK